MPQTIGLSTSDKKYIEFLPFSTGSIPASASLYIQAKDFFKAFKEIFGDGSKKIITDSETFEMANLDLIVPALILYHFAIECMLKSLIHKYKKQNTQVENIHDLAKLLSTLKAHCPSISLNSSEELILEELGASCIKMRYGEGTICFSHNKNVGSIRPMQEFSEYLDNIFEKLNNLLT
jgi:hypothetical protein